MKRVGMDVLWVTVQDGGTVDKKITFNQKSKQAKINQDS
jgi:hypothetical protein